VTLHPGESTLIKFGTIPALLSGVATAIALIAIRILGKTETIDRVLFYYFLVGTLLTAGVLCITQRWILPREPELWLELILIALLMLMSQYLISKAYSYASAVRLSPFNYSTLVFAGIIAWIFWGEIPGWYTIVGTILIVAGVILSLTVGGTTFPQVPKK
jgi:drug/metabolite transporter (DMT)-like permease